MGNNITLEIIFYCDIQFYEMTYLACSTAPIYDLI